MRVALVANARSGTETDADAVEDALRARGAEVARLDVADAAQAGAPRRWPGGPEPAPPERIVVAGGDGSIGPAAHAAHRAGLPVAIIPTGTANDFARALDLPLDPEAAVALAADPAARTRAVELAESGDRRFVNAAGAGLSVVAARRAAPLKPRLGALAYAAGAVRAGLTAHPIHATVRVDGDRVHDGPAWQVVVGATGAFGGGSGLDAADPHDGLLDVVVLPAGSRAGLVRRAWGLRLGRISRQPGVRHARGRHVEIAVPSGTAWNVDGELCHLPDPRFRAHPGAVEVVVP